MYMYIRGRSRGGVQEVHPSHPQDDLQLNEIRSILEKKKKKHEMRLKSFLCSVLPPKKNPGSTPVYIFCTLYLILFVSCKARS